MSSSLKGQEEAAQTTEVLGAGGGDDMGGAGVGGLDGEA